MTTTLIHPLQPAGSSAHLEYYNSTSKVMALDTIKTTKNPKSFPFTSPTITKHNNPATGALILEIIFSSDDVSSPEARGQEDDMEDDNSDESEDEDDVNSANSDTHSHHGEDDRDGDVENDGEDEDVEDDEESGDEEDLEDGDLEDFENDFDKDLIIDFGNEEHEEDQLVIDFEDSPPHSPTPTKASPVPPANTIPFWFTHEESGKPLVFMLFTTNYLFTSN
jgi:hypothetical protein